MSNERKNYHVEWDADPDYKFLVPMTSREAVSLAMAMRLRGCKGVMVFPDDGPGGVCDLETFRTEYLDELAPLRVKDGEVVDAQDRPVAPTPPWSGPGGEPSNEDRVGWADQAVEAHSEATGIADEDAITELGDLLANLRHWADAHGVDWHEALARGQGHYDEEVLEELELLSEELEDE